MPEGPDWIYELKLDGYRAQALCKANGVRLLSRNGNDLTKRFPETVAALAEAMIPPTSVDGELVALDTDGRPSFQTLQGATRDPPVVFYAFDILSHAGKSMTALSPA